MLIKNIKNLKKFLIYDASANIKEKLTCKEKSVICIVNKKKSKNLITSFQ